MKSLRIATILAVFTCSVAAAQNNPRPLVNQPLIPASVAPGGGGFTLTVTGTGFASTAVVQWNRSARATTFVSASKLQATITASDVARAGTASVSVVNPAPGGGPSNIVYLPIRQSSTVLRGARDRNFVPISREIAIGDFNNDGNLDVAVANAGPRIDIYLGNGDGTFRAPVSTVITEAIQYLVAADFDGDGNLDLLAYGATQSRVAVLFGKGDGTLTQGPTTAVASGLAFAVADFNGDGILDFVEGEPDSFGGPSLEVYLGNENGTFRPSASFEPCCFNFTTLSAIGDFNGDGKLDFVNSDQVFLGRGDGTFTTDSVPYTDMNFAVATADVNGDGNLDLISDRGAVSLGYGNGTFLQTNDLFFTGSDVVLADLNGDGRLDMVMLAILGDSQQIEVLLGNGDGSFQKPILAPAGISAGGTQFDRLRLGDFNNDGKLDVIVGAKGTVLVLQK